MTKRDDLRHLLGDLAWRGVQVFVAALLVELANGELLPAVRRVEFWREVAIAAAIAVVSQALTFAAYQLTHRAGRSP